MATYFYKVVKSTCPNDPDVPAEYGIAASAIYDGCTVILSSVHHLSRDPDAVTALADFCNRLELDPLHLADVVEDFLGQL